MKAGKSIVPRAAACALALALAAPAAAQEFGTGAFPNARAVETQLKRGVSTKADVQKLLGVPNGSGAALLPPLGPAPQEIWYYEDFEATDIKSQEGVVRMNMRMQLLLVFFKGEVFDGYLWSSNRAPFEGK